MRTKKFKLFFVINSLEGGGAEKVLCNLLSWLQPYATQHGGDLHLVLLDKAIETQKCPDFVTKHCLDAGGSLVTSAKRLNGLIKQHNPNQVIAFLTRSNIVSTVLCKWHKIPCTISERVNTSSHFADGFAGKISKMLIRLCYPLANNIVAVSGGVKHDLVENFGLSESKINTIYNAYETEKLTQYASETPAQIPKRPYIVAAGRLSKNKNFALLLEAYAKAQLTEDLVILGQGPEFENLQNLAHKLAIAERVHFKGYQSNPYPFFKHAAFFVSSSNAEGFPNAIAEAMCLGKAVVATDCPSGPAEILAETRLYTNNSFEAKNGLLCPVNDVDTLTNALQHMCNKTTREYYQNMAVQRAQAFSPQNMCNAFIQLIERQTPDQQHTVIQAQHV